jgi:phosphoenolpyruvate carboxykinase (ATP)
LLEQAVRSLGEERIISVDVQAGDGTEGITARLIVPRRYAHVAYGGLKLFKPAMTQEPAYQVVMFFDEAYENNKAKSLPEKDVTIRRNRSHSGAHFSAELTWT